ncbi:MAG: redox-regulated ATPase YchF [Candidatus Woesearchaeota archaeon]
MLVGIVGKANVGKSTFFKALTLINVEIANYPFTTLKPNHGIAYVRVESVGKEFNVVEKPKSGFVLGNYRFVPFEVLDVAGLVPGAHKGKGMGNQFLDDLRQADALIHVVDISGSTNENGEPVTLGSYDPVKDVIFLEEEIDLWYLQILKRSWESFSKKVHLERREAFKEIAKQFSGLKITEHDVKSVMESLNLDHDLLKWTDSDLFEFTKMLRKRTKPIIIAANKADCKNAEENIKRIKESFPNTTIIPCSAESELALREAANHGLIEYIPGDSDFKIINPEKLSEKQLAALDFIRQNVLKRFGNTGVQQVVDYVVFNVLKQIAVFPVANSKLEDSQGNVLPDCFLVQEGTTALDFAYKVHTSFGENFVRAIDLRTKMVIGRDHVLKHRDIIQIIADK